MDGADPDRNGEAPGADTLDAIFRRLIAATGPISVRHYMAEANARYYTDRDPLGSGGDFVTAPEISQMFGEMVGLWLADVWIRAGRPDPCHYVELGPGRGTLASDVLRTVRRFGLHPKLHFVEGSETLCEIQYLSFPGAEWHEGLESVPREGPLLIVANEFFDCLPVQQIVATEEGWRERMVGHDGTRFLPIAGPRDMTAMVPETLREAATGTIVESCPAAAGYAFEIASRLQTQRGCALLIDYGYEGPVTGSSLQAVRQHRKVDPFEAPGTADLTAHVDFAEMLRIADSVGAFTEGPVGQGDWLKALGIELRAQALVDTLAGEKPDEAKQVFAALNRLTHGDEMGALFKVCAMRSPGWPRGEGLGDGPPRQASDDAEGNWSRFPAPKRGSAV